MTKTKCFCIKSILLQKRKNISQLNLLWICTATTASDHLSQIARIWNEPFSTDFCMAFTVWFFVTLCFFRIQNPRCCPKMKMELLHWRKHLAASNGKNKHWLLVHRQRNMTCNVCTIEITILWLKPNIAGSWEMGRHGKWWCDFPKKNCDIQNWKKKVNTEIVLKELWLLGAVGSVRKCSSQSPVKLITLGYTPWLKHFIQMAQQ